MRPRPSVCLFAGLTCLALLVAACGEEIVPTNAGQASTPEATIEAVITPAPTQTSVPIDQNPTPPAGEPRLIEISTDISQLVTPELLAGSSRLVIVGVVREHLTPQWSTADGSRPEEILGSTSNTIYTPVVIDLDQPPLMDLNGGHGDVNSIVVLIEGGTIDEVTITHTGSFYDLPVGARVVLGVRSMNDTRVAAELGDAFDQYLAGGVDTLWFPQVRFIIADGSVSSDSERYAEDAFFARLNAEIERRISR